MKTPYLGLFGLAAILVTMTTATDAVGLPTSASYIGQLQPIGLPAGVTFGGNGNSFNHRTDVSGSRAVVGAGIFGQGADQGYAFVYDFSNPSSIQQIATLRASDHAAGNEFGDGVAISGNYVFVGAHGDSSDRGAVYMYDISDPQNIVERKITAFDAAPHNEFGYSLSVDGNRLIVGAPKFYTLSTLPAAAYIIDFSDPDHLQQAKIASPIGSLGALSVAISGNHAIVGQPSDSSAFPFAGSAHLYDISDLNAISVRDLRATDAPNYRDFGAGVAISGNKALVSVVSDPGPTNNAGTLDGAVWAFDFSNLNNIRQREFGRPTDSPFGLPVPPFGSWLDLQGDLAIAGAFNEDAGRGGIYFYDVSNVLAPSRLFRLPAHSDSDLRFGTSLAVDGQTLLVSDRAQHVYLYRLVPEPALHELFAIACGAAIFCRRYRGPKLQSPAKLR